jgi:FtsZ-interacting cell division protein ZipA
LDLNPIVSDASLILAAVAVIFTAVVTWRSRKSTAEREAAALQLKRSSDRMEAQEEEIAVNASREAVRILRGELNAAHTDDTRNREIMDKQNERIDAQGRVIRRQNVRIELQHEEIRALRRWAAEVKRLLDAGITGIPDVPRATEIGDTDLWPEDV